MAAILPRYTDSELKNTPRKSPPTTATDLRWLGQCDAETALEGAGGQASTSVFRSRRPAPNGDDSLVEIGCRLTDPSDTPNRAGLAGQQPTCARSAGALSTFALRRVDIRDQPRTSPRSANLHVALVSVTGDRQPSRRVLPFLPMTTPRFKAPEACAFCDASGPMSREHTFARWMTRFIPVSNLTNHEIVSTRRDSLLELSPKTRRRISGPPTSRRQPIVCLACNSGWMSQLEERVKPVLGPMLQGTPTPLDVEAQRLLARWIDKTIMVYEFEFPDNAVTTSAQRGEFMLLAGPSQYTRAWIGHFVGGSDYPRPRHHTWGFTGPAGERILTQRVDTITMGQVIFYVTSAIDATAVVEDYPASAIPDYLAQIWPVKDDVVLWPLPHSINGRQHRWLADWRVTDLSSELPEWPPFLPKIKVSPILWALLDDQEITESSEDAPLDPGFPPRPPSGHADTF
jgi:hypothetical protein